MKRTAPKLPSWFASKRFAILRRLEEDRKATGAGAEAAREFARAQVSAVLEDYERQVVQYGRHVAAVSLWLDALALSFGGMPECPRKHMRLVVDHSDGRNTVQRGLCYWCGEVPSA